MRCDQVIPLISAYYDDELAADERDAIAKHVSSCGGCAQRLKSIQNLSALVQRSPIPPTPSTLLKRLEGVMDDSSNEVLQRPAPLRRRMLMGAVLATAATFAGLVVMRFLPTHTNSHGDMAAVYGRFLDAYSKGAEDAPQVLVNHYQGKPINVQTAAQVLKHNSVAPPILLAKHRIADRFQLRMPDCDCVATVYKCDGKTSLVLFEHDKEHADWFDARRSIQSECRGKSCCLVQLNDRLAAIWPVNGGYVTVVGVRDVEELGSVMDELKLL